MPGSPSVRYDIVECRICTRIEKRNALQSAKVILGLQPVVVARCFSLAEIPQYRKLLFAEYATLGHSP